MKQIALPTVADKRKPRVGQQFLHVPETADLVGPAERYRKRTLAAIKRPLRTKTVMTPSMHHLPLHLQLLSYVTHTTGATYQEMAVNFEVPVRSVRIAIRRLEKNRLVRTKMVEKRIEVTAVNPAAWTAQAVDPEMFFGSDTFCGGGGMSLGAGRAFEASGIDLWNKMRWVALNHWEEAIKVHEANHKWAVHVREDIAVAQPRELFPGGYLHLLLSSPSCVGFSRARGSKPVNPQLRTHAWQIVRWCRDLDVQTIVVENVADIMLWGPEEWVACPCTLKMGNPSPTCAECNGKGLAAQMVKDGSVFRKWIRELRLLGYTLWYDVLNAADYGDATKRERFFLVGMKNVANEEDVPRPVQTHSKVNPKTGQPSVPGTLPWVPASDFIDWDNRGADMLDRKKAHSQNTWRRVQEGLLRYAGIDIGAIVDDYKTLKAAIEGDHDARAKVEAHLVKEMDDVARRAFLVKFYGTAKTSDLNAPLGAIGAQGGHYGVVRADVEGDFLVDTHGSKDAYPARVKSPGEPLGAQTGASRWGLAAWMIDNFGENTGKKQRPRVRPLSEPSAVVTSRGAGNLIRATMEDDVEAAFLSPFYGNSTPSGINAPCPTATGKARFGLVVIRRSGKRGRLRLEFRMLSIEELGGIMGFPRDYKWPRKKDGSIHVTDATLMIGNAVAAHMAQALVTAVVGPIKKRMAAAAAA